MYKYVVIFIMPAMHLAMVYSVSQVHPSIYPCLFSFRKYIHAFLGECLHSSIAIAGIIS